MAPFPALLRAEKDTGGETAMKKTYHKIRMKYIWSYLAIIIITCTAIISVIVFYTNNFFREKLTNFSQAQMQECITMEDANEGEKE